METRASKRKANNLAAPASEPAVAAPKKAAVDRKKAKSEEAPAPATKPSKKVAAKKGKAAADETAGGDAGADTSATAIAPAEVKSKRTKKATSKKGTDLAAAAAAADDDDGAAVGSAAPVVAKTNSKKATSGGKKSGKVASVASDSVALLLVNNLRSAREKKRNEQAANAKEKGWSFDPRAKIVVEPTLYDLCVEGLSCLDEVVDYYIKKYTFATADDAPSEATAAETYCANATAEVSGMGNFSDEEIMAFGFTRLLQLVPATHICDLAEAAAASGTVKLQSKEDIVAFLKDGVDMEKLLVAHPHTPYFKDVTVIKSEGKDERDAESGWCDKFYNHMMWLFQKFEEQRCHSLGRIDAALGNRGLKVEDESLTKEFQALVISRIGGSCWRATEASAKKEDASANEEAADDDDSNGAQGFLAVMKRQHLARHAVLSYPLDYRTYVGTFCFNIRESDYDGCRSGIANYVEDSACEFFDPQLFVQIDAVGGDVTEVDNLVTSAFYIPGVKNSDDDDDNGEAMQDGADE